MDVWSPYYVYKQFGYLYYKIVYDKMNTKIRIKVVCYICFITAKNVGEL